MGEAQERNMMEKRDERTLLLVIAAFVVVVAIGVFAFLRFYDAYIDRVLYQERLNQMQEVTSQLFSGLEDVVAKQWDDVDAYCNYVELGKPQDSQTLLTFMTKQATLNNMAKARCDLVAVDDLGRYMTQNGWQGTLSEMDMLLDQPERISFVSQSLTDNQTRMYFLKRLPQPVEMQDGHRTVQIIYYGISQDMAQLNAYFSCEAYDNSNSVYVLNRQGMKLFRSSSSSSSSSSSLIDGYNAYSVLSDMQYLHGNAFEDARAELDANGRGYANAVLNGQEYYYALYRMENAEWTLLFLVPSAYVATNVVVMVGTTVRLIMVFAVLLMIVAATVIIILLQFQQKRALDVERRNSAKLERLNTQLEAASQAKTTFLANMSHDIRTPMNAIVGITNLMDHDRSDPAKMDTYIRKVKQSSSHLLSLVNDILDMSKIESSEVTLNAEQVSLAEQVGQIESIVRPQAEEHGQHFTLRVHEIRHEYLIGDAVRLRQIFINLLSNAVKYTPNGGEITMDLSELPCDIPDHAAFRTVVADNGYGMSPEFLKHIFEPFTRAENSTVNRVQGTGLGMAITKNIVDLMGGTITVQSEVDQGSRFTVDLTLLIDSSVTLSVPCKNVLLITDEDTLIDNARASLSEANIALHVATSPAEADAQLAALPMDLVLLGGTLQGDTLSDNIARLRQKTGSAILIYCCTYEEQAQVRRMVLGGQVDDLIVRPFFLSNLLHAVERVKNDIQPQAEPDKSVLRGMRFLCAEDNTLNAEILSAILDMNGASCTIYPDGRRLVDAFTSVKPGDYDAILMDVQMPVMNGLDATRAIRRGENPLGRTIPIIAMTANAFSEDVQSCLDAGMDAHVSKPLDIAVLERTVQGIAGIAGGGDICPPVENSALPR